MKSSSIYTSLFLIITLVFLGSCKSSETLKSELYFDEIEYGGGGGFAGTYEYFILDKRGILFHKEQEKKGKILDSISRDEILEIDQLAQKLVKSGVEQDRSGNMTFKILISSKDSTFSYRWPDESDYAKPEIADLYLKLKKIKNPLIPVEN